MADWKQIQARIRRARTGADPAGQLAKLYEKTRDAMAAFELAKHLEGAGQSAEAARWYSTAAEQFRRANWKKKAEEAAARLGGGPIGGEVQAERMNLAPFEAGAEVSEAESIAPIEAAFEPTQAGSELAEQTAESPSVLGTTPLPGKKRRRGRRGGRNRRRGKDTASAPAAAPAPPSQAAPEKFRAEPHAPSRGTAQEPLHTPTSEATGPGIRGRSGDPALASRIAQLEMQLRRLLACSPLRMEQADHAPAGPGVFVLTDSDQITYYYAEACATLRIGIANVLRSSASRRGEESLKARFADHLGVPESRVSKFVNDHCVVRWLQLDEGATTFAHFTIAVLRPVLNE